MNDGSLPKIKVVGAMKSSTFRFVGNLVTDPKNTGRLGKSINTSSVQKVFNEGGVWFADTYNTRYELLIDPMLIDYLRSRHRDVFE